MNDEQILLRRPKKKLIDRNKIYEFNEMEASEKRAFVLEIVQRIKEIMKKHIGREKAINSEELFESVYLIASTTLTNYEIYFWRQLINKVISKLRNAEELFIINEGGKRIYVLKTVDELKIFKNQMDNYIEGCNVMKEKAERWVKNKTWKN